MPWLLRKVWRLDKQNTPIYLINIIGKLKFNKQTFYVEILLFFFTFVHTKLSDIPSVNAMLS